MPVTTFLDVVDSSDAFFLAAFPREELVEKESRSGIHSHTEVDRIRDTCEAVDIHTEDSPDLHIQDSHLAADTEHGGR